MIFHRVPLYVYVSRKQFMYHQIILTVTISALVKLYLKLLEKLCQIPCFGVQTQTRSVMMSSASLWI